MKEFVIYDLLNGQYLRENNEWVNEINNAAFFSSEETTEHRIFSDKLKGYFTIIPCYNQ